MPAPTQNGNESPTLSGIAAHHRHGTPGSRQPFSFFLCGGLRMREWSYALSPAIISPFAQAPWELIHRRRDVDAVSGTERFPYLSWGVPEPRGALGGLSKVKAFKAQQCKSDLTFCSCAGKNRRERHCITRGPPAIDASSVSIYSAASFVNVSCCTSKSLERRDNKRFTTSKIISGPGTLVSFQVPGPGQIVRMIDDPLRTRPLPGSKG